MTGKCVRIVQSTRLLPVDTGISQKLYLQRGFVLYETTFRYLTTSLAESDEAAYLICRYSH